MQDAGCRVTKLLDWNTNCVKNVRKKELNFLLTLIFINNSIFQFCLSRFKLSQAFFLSYLGLPARGDDGENASSIIAKNSLASITVS